MKRIFKLFLAIISCVIGCKPSDTTTSSPTPSWVLLSPIDHSSDFQVIAITKTGSEVDVAYSEKWTFDGFDFVEYSVEPWHGEGGAYYDNMKLTSLPGFIVFQKRPGDNPVNEWIHVHNAYDLDKLDYYLYNENSQIDSFQP